MRGAWRYVMVSAGLGVVAAFVMAFAIWVVDGVWRPVNPFRWLHPNWSGPMVLAVVGAAFLVRSWLRHGVLPLAAGIGLALLASLMCGVLWPIAIAMREHSRGGFDVRFVLIGLIYAPFACVLLCPVTFPLGWLFAWILRRVLRAETPPHANEPSSAP